MDGASAAELAFHPLESLLGLLFQLLAGTAAVDQRGSGTEAQPDSHCDADGLAHHTVAGNHFFHTKHIAFTPLGSLHPGMQNYTTIIFFFLQPFFEKNGFLCKKK